MVFWGAIFVEVWLMLGACLHQVPHQIWTLSLGIVLIWLQKYLEQCKSTKCNIIILLKKTVVKICMLLLSIFQWP